MFQTLAIMNPTVRFDDVDILVNRNTLQKLYRFAEYKRSYTQFFVDLDMVGRAMYIGRREKNTKIQVHAGHGRNFEKMFTTEDQDLVDVDGHHPVVGYQLGGLNIMVRMEADGYYDEKELANSDDADEFFRNFLGVVGSASEAIPHSDHCHTQIITRGKLMSHNSSLELKCNHPNAESIQQIWFGRVPHTIYGRHKAGIVGTLEELHWKHDFQKWATVPQNQVSLRRLVWLLEEMRKLVVEKTNGHAVLVAMERGAPLQVFQAKQSWGALPREIIERFWEGAAKPCNRDDYFM
ncbi:hypothetical protein T440DRAFT_532375 [Plenodomus tracheiphilus IPT5]|uniref:Decapping nuclease n=1 Tax=Plenodomus tracheiphilus IPT5 TaxID=1408161 RepID=A0A6A7B3M9_9PLEO|nr:hypothetical protein T440DRAFT_532375 [Plenodomus tracheiphilus IPT5]